MQKSFLVSLSGTLIGCALLGAGCVQTRPVEFPPQTSSTTVTSSSSTPVSSPTSTPVVGTETPQLILVEGQLPVFGKIALTFTLGKERVQGRYTSDKGGGSLYGMVTSTPRGQMEFSLQKGDEDAGTFSGSYDRGRGALVGTYTQTGSAVAVPVAFLPQVLKEGANIQLKTIEREQTFKKGFSCHTSLEYPVIVANDYIPAERADEMNRSIRSFMGETATTTLEMQVDATQADCASTQQEMLADPSFSSEEASGLNDYEYETTTLVNRNERSILSLVYSTYYYTGGAHPNSFNASQAFDLMTGKELSLRDLVRADVLPTWIQREQRAVLRSEYGDMLFDAAEATKLSTGALKGDAASSTAAYTSYDQWYLTGNTLVRYYQPYEIAPYSAGMPSVELPFSTWKDLAVPGVERWFR